ncbi:MAG: hypothetical protein U0800_03330 [Isosphaeraceae bacterium]
MPRSIASWMALVARPGGGDRAGDRPKPGPSRSWRRGDRPGGGDPWGIARRSWTALAFAAVAILRAWSPSTPTSAARTPLHAALIRAHDWIGPHREGETRLPRSSFDESYSKWIEAHPDRWVHAVILDEEGATLRWGEPTLDPFLKIAGRLLALLPAALVAAILAAWDRRRAGRKEAPRCPA